jgi:hypothetical protein
MKEIVIVLEPLEGYWLCSFEYSLKESTQRYIYTSMIDGK